MHDADPIRVFVRDGIWIVDYGSYTHGEYLTRTEAVATARAAAEAEGRTVAVDKLGTWIVPEGA